MARRSTSTGSTAQARTPTKRTAARKTNANTKASATTKAKAKPPASKASANKSVANKSVANKSVTNKKTVSKAAANKTPVKRSRRVAAPAETKPVDINDDSVRLTDISEIVAKYSVVDRLFVNEDDDSDQDNQRPAERRAPTKSNAQVETVEAVAEIEVPDDDVEPDPFDDDPVDDHAEDAFDDFEDDIFEDDDEAEHDDGIGEPEDEDHDLFASGPDLDAPSRLRDNSLIFHKIARPRRRDELYSNWSSDARRVSGDMDAPVDYDSDGYGPDGYERELIPAETPEAEQIVQNHKRTLTRTVALCAALPLVAGITFALTLYIQKDVRPSELWSWMTAETTGPVVAANAPSSSTGSAPVPLAPSQWADNSSSPTVTPAEPAVTASPETLSGGDTALRAVEPEPSAPTAVSAQGSPATQLYMAKLSVADTSGSAQEPIPLALNVTRAIPDQRIRVRISGLPEGAQLSAGTHLGNGEWALYEPDLQNLTMTLPDGFSGSVTLYAMVIDDATHIQSGDPTNFEVRVAPTGEQAEVVQPVAADASATSFADSNTASNQSPARTESVVPQRSLFPELQMIAPERTSEAALPQSGAPAPSNTATPQANQPGTQVASINPTVPSTPAPSTGVEARSVPSSDGSSLITKGDELLGLGDISSARLMYQRAARNGDPRAATAMGRTFDPIVFSRGEIKVHGVRPNPQTAAEWYQRAVQAGDVRAQQHLDALNAWMQRSN